MSDSEVRGTGHSQSVRVGISPADYWGSARGLHLLIGTAGPYHLLCLSSCPMPVYSLPGVDLSSARGQDRESPYNNSEVSAGYSPTYLCPSGQPPLGEDSRPQALRDPPLHRPGPG